MLWIWRGEDMTPLKLNEFIQDCSCFCFLFVVELISALLFFQDFLTLLTFFFFCWGRDRGERRGENMFNFSFLFTLVLFKAFKN